MRRCRLQRDSLRIELSAFVVKRAGSRSLIHIMWPLGEVREYYGSFELAAAGTELLADDASHW